MKITEMYADKYGHINARVENGPFVLVDALVLKDLEIPGVLIKKRTRVSIVPATAENMAISLAQAAAGELR
jgi:hypothetical protein